MSGRQHAEAVRWFRQAQHDQRAVRWNIDGGFYSTACFLAQQAAEKAVKSLLYHLGARRSALMSHSITEMVQEAESALVSSGTLEHARSLDLHYIPSRYPNGLPSGYPHQFYGRETAERAAESSEAILTVVRSYYEARGENEILRLEE